MKRILALAAPLFFLACPAETPTPPLPAPTAASAPAKAAGGVVAAGTLTLPEGADGKGAAVFVSLRGAGGPPIAAKKLPAGPFPMKFELSEADKLAMGGTPRPIPAEFTLKITLDIDGDPMSPSPGDLTISQQVKSGTTGLALQLAPRP